MGQFIRESKVPNTLAQIRKKIKEYKRQGRKIRVRVYQNMNKEYKQFDWTNKYFLSKDVKQHLNDSYFKCYRRLLSDKQLLVRQINANDYAIERQNLQGICLLKQLCAQVDDKYFTQKKNKKRKRKVKYLKFYYQSAYTNKMILAYYTKEVEWKIPFVRQFLSKKEYIFDSTNQFYKGMSQIKKFVKNSLINCKIQRWDYNFQRFLRIKTK